MTNPNPNPNPSTAPAAPAKVEEAKPPEAKNSTAETASTHVYILVAGKHHKNVNGELKVMKVGEATTLTPAQAEAFKDKFKPKAVVDAEKKAADAAAKAAAEIAEAAEKNA